MRRDELLVEALRSLTAVAIADIDAEGRLRDANAGFLRLLPPGAPGAPGSHVGRYFASPGLSDLAGRARAGEAPVYEGLVTIGDPAAGSPRSLRGRVFADADGLLVIAECDVEELERVSDTALELSNELADMGRELLSAHRKLQQREAEIRRLSLTDSLTGLANRRRLDEALATEIERARRYGSRLAFVLLDIDHFKRVNDEYGHGVGDAVIRAVADTLQSQVRESDVAARWGGEEFAVLLPETGAEAAAACAERIRAALERAQVPPVAWTLSASLGVAELAPGEDPHSLVKRADDALYRAKDAGRNRVVVAEAPQGSV